jgi:hypothetical protein
MTISQREIFFNEIVMENYYLKSIIELDDGVGDRHAYHFFKRKIFVGVGPVNRLKINF